MNKDRFQQLRDIWLRREEIDIKFLNKETLKNLPDDILKKYVFHFLEKYNFSESDLKNLQLKMNILDNENLDKKIPLIKYLYKILTEKILLPNYVSEKSEEIIFKEIDKIIENTKNKSNKNLEKIQKDWFFYLWFSDIDDIFKEYEYFWKLSEDYLILGWIFWGVSIESDENNILKITIPVRVWKKVKHWENKEKNFISDKKFNEIISEVIENNSLKKYIDLKINEKILDKNRDFWNEEDIYNVIEITNLDEYISKNFLGTHDLNAILSKIFSATNQIINGISKRSGIKQNPRYFNYNSSILFYWNNESENETNENFWLSKDEIETFENNYKVKMSEKITLNEIWGQDQAKAEVEKIIKWIKFEETMKEWWAKSTSWIIFEWPSWTWKTLLAKAIANEVDAEILNVKLTDIASSAYINEWAVNIKKLFSFIRHKAKKTWKKIIVILDELDAIFGKRDGRWSSEDTKIVNTFLTEMSGLNDLQNVLIIWTTNLIENIDNAVIRSWRISTKVKVDLPNKEWLNQIFQIHINKAKKKSKKFEKVMTLENFENILEKANWISGADVEEIIRIIVEKKALQEINWEEIWEITEQDFFEAIEKIKKTWTKMKMWFL